MLRSATVLALVGTAAAAGTYPTKAESCSAFESMLSCQMLDEKKDGCVANTNCQWILNTTEYDDPFCTVLNATQLQMEYAQMNASAALVNQTEACLEITDEADCSGSCGWGKDSEARGEWVTLCVAKDYRSLSAEDFAALDQNTQDALTSMNELCAVNTAWDTCEAATATLDGNEFDCGSAGSMEVEPSAQCMVSRAKAQSMLLADGATPFVRGGAYYDSSASVTCYGLDKVNCAATEGCVYEEGECGANDFAAMLMVNNKCDGSANSLLVEYANYRLNTTNFTTVDDLYEEFNVPAEYSAAKLANQAAEKAKVAQEKTAAAETAKAAIPTTNLAEADKAKLDFLADAAINGQTVKKVVTTLTADDTTSACTNTFNLMGLTSDDGACTAVTARRRKLLASYSTTVLLNPAKVDETKAAAAVAKIQADTSVTTTVTDEDPVDEIEAIPNIDATAVATFKTSAAEAADANIEAQAYEAEKAEMSAASSVAAVSAIATAALAAAACVFA